MQRTIPTDIARQHRLSLELAIRALQEQSLLIYRHRVEYDDSDAECVSLLISDAAVTLGLASDYLRAYCPDSTLYSSQSIFSRVIQQVKKLFRGVL